MAGMFTVILITSLQDSSPIYNIYIYINRFKYKHIRFIYLYCIYQEPREVGIIRS